MNIPEIMKMTPNKHDIQFLDVQSNRRMYFDLKISGLYRATIIRCESKVAENRLRFPFILPSEKKVSSKGQRIHKLEMIDYHSFQTVNLPSKLCRCLDLSRDLLRIKLPFDKLIIFTNR